jgi:hypothetical protein
MTKEQELLIRALKTIELVASIPHPKFTKTMRTPFNSEWIDEARDVSAEIQRHLAAHGVGLSDAEQRP